MLRHMELFAGAGGGLLGAKLAGLETVCAVEIDGFRRGIIQKRMEEGWLKEMKIRRRVEGIEGEDWKGKVDVISGGFPCQDISAAGKGKGIEEGQRSGLWREFGRILCEVRPKFAYVENSPRITVKGIDKVLGDLAAMGYDAEWQVLSAAECDAPHLRRRMWILGVERGEISDGLRRRLAESFKASGIKIRAENEANIGEQFAKKSGWPSEPELDRVADGVADRVDRIKAIGAGQVPRVFARSFWGLLSRRLDLKKLAEESLKMEAREILG